MLTKPLLLVPAVIAFAFAPMAAPAPVSQDAPAAAKSSVKITPESQAKAHKLYEVDCAMCHGANGSGKTDIAKSMQMTLDDWTDPKTLAGKPDQVLFDAIRKGKDKMPPEAEGRAKNDDVWNLIHYIRSMAKEPAASPAPDPAPAAQQ